eukprot:sb/3476614/
MAELQVQDITTIFGCLNNCFSESRLPWQLKILADCCAGCWGCYAAAAAEHNSHVAVVAVAAVALSGNVVPRGIVAETVASAFAVGTEIKKVGLKQVLPVKKTRGIQQPSAANHPG